MLKYGHFFYSKNIFFKANSGHLEKHSLAALSRHILRYVGFLKIINPITNIQWEKKNFKYNGHDTQGNNSKKTM